MSKRTPLRGRAPLFGLLIVAPLVVAKVIPTGPFDRLATLMRLPGQIPTILTIGTPEPGTVSAQAFTLDRPQELRVEATGADMESARRIAKGRNILGRLVMSFVKSEDRFEDENWPANAWILDAATREVVWELRRNGADRDRDQLVHFEGTVRLPAGSYETYYAFFPLDWHMGKDGWAWLTRSDEDAYKELGIRVRGEGRSTGEVRPPVEADPSTVVAFTRIGDDAHERVGFSLERPTLLDIRAIGEASGGTTYDYGWIINADTRDRVWELTYENSQPAGGAEKNRVSRSRITLPAGRYAAFFVTDDSHSSAGWNATPPLDPFRYGLTIRVTDPSVRASVKTFEYEPVPRAQAIAALTGVRDNEYRSRGFTLKRPLGVRIFALGEGDDETMYDWAWITNAKTGQMVWDMAKVGTEHAGGASKNRLFDGTIRLESGSYVVHYASDGSHSADSWNDTPPADRDFWGVTILPAAGTLDRSIIAEYDPDNDPAIFARMVGVRDGQVSRRRFTMDRDGAVRVYALGEGVGDEMVDYAWIIDTESGRRVWEMKYADTEHAGGAEKNRVFDGTIRLVRGDYELVYRSDDSHSFGEWNSPPPRDFTNWGVTLYRVR
jgi:hypothetical protein